MQWICLTTVLLGQASGHVLHLARQGEGFRVPDAAILNPNEALTVEAWVHPQPYDSAGPFHFIVSKNYGGRGYALLLIGRGDAYRIQFEANGVARYEIPMWVLSAGWWHVAGVARSNLPPQLFLNGVKVAEGNSTGPLTSCERPLCIGTSPWDSFIGDLDEVRIWNVARSQSEIVGSMRRRLSGREPGLIAYWDFERTKAGKLIDRTSKSPAVSSTGERVRIGAMRK